MNQILEVSQSIANTLSMYELIIRNAKVADGMGNPLITADVAIKDGRIAKIGNVTGSSKNEVDAMGLVLAPGIIDVHTHYDAQLTWDSTASPSPALGVTTVIIGNCGFGIAPATPDTRDLILANLSEVEAMSLDSLKAGVDWDFESFPEFLEMLRRKGAYPNVACFASHSAMRTVVMKEAGSQRAATPDELETMTAMFREAMQAGAMGLGSSTFENHNGQGGIPVPSRLADDDEFRAFAKVMSEFNHGLTVITCGDRTTIEFLEELSNISHRPAVFAPLLHYSNQPDRAKNLMHRCQAARARGALVYAQASCQPLSMDFTLDKAYPLMTVQPWSELKHGDHNAMMASFADPEFAQRMRDALANPDGGRIFNGNWERVEVTMAALDKNQSLVGKNIAAIAKERDADPVDVFLGLGVEENLQTTFTAKLLNVEEEKVWELLQDPGNMVSLSDGGAHLTFFCDAGFGMYFLGHWVRDLGKLDLVSAIKKLTSDVADIYGFTDRGRLVEGAYADMILFDPKQIGISSTQRLNDLPSGATRLVRSAPGLHTVWVNGVGVYHDGDYTAVTPPGQVLTKFSATRPRVGMDQ